LPANQVAAPQIIVVQSVLLPRRIVHSTFDKTSGKESPRTMRPVTRITFTYEPFRSFDVSTATDIKEPGRD